LCPAYILIKREMLIAAGKNCNCKNESKNIFV